MYIQAGIVTVVVLIAMVVVWVALAERRDYKKSWYHCGVRVSPAYVRAMQRLIDPQDTVPYRIYVLRLWHWRTWQLWRMAVRVERLVFGREDDNTAWQLWKAAVWYLLTTGLVVGVDQRGVHAFYQGESYPVVFGMMRDTWGSVFGLVTYKALKKPKYWNIRNRRNVLKRNGMPWYAPFWRRVLDVTMIAVLKEYEGKTKYTGYVPVTLGLLAQTCQLAEDRRMRWWFTILEERTFSIIQYLTGSPWQVIEGVGDKWIPYFGSQGSNAFICDFPAWIARTYVYDRKKFDKFFRGGMSNWFRYAERRTPLREPVGI